MPAASVKTCLAIALLTVVSVASAQPREPIPSPPEQAPDPPRPPRWRYDHHHFFGEALVRFDSDAPGVQLLVHAGVVPFERHYWGYHYGGWYHRGYAPVYSPVCEGPCAVPMPPGHYRFALAKDGGPLVPIDFPVLIRGPAEIRGHYVDRSGTRTAGVLVGIGGTLAGVVMLAASEGHERVCDNFGACYQRSTTDGTLVAGGIGVLLGSIIVGAVLVSQRDEATISVRPLVMGALGESRALTATVPIAIRPPQGGTLALSF